VFGEAIRRGVLIDGERGKVGSGASVSQLEEYRVVQMGHE
jgi:hypothetical protein